VIIYFKYVADGYEAGMVKLPVTAF